MSTVPSVDVRFCRMATGESIAYSTQGTGSPLVLVPGWLCHLEEMWRHYASATSLEQLSRAHTFAWYDRVGCGLSQRECREFSLDHDVEQLKTVMDAAAIGRATIIGYSLGGPVAAAFAARYPERVDRLVFYATFARGASVSTPDATEALQRLIATSWALGSKTFATMFLPNGTGQDLRWFARFQRLAATGETAARLLDHLRALDVSAILPSLALPVLVLHNRRDPAIPVDNGREVASLVPGARLHLLEGNEHDPFIRDSGSVVESILAFAAGRVPPMPGAGARVESNPPLTAREREVLRLLAAGDSNKEIALRLKIASATVERHLTNIYGKLGARGRADAVLYALRAGLATAGVR